MLSIYRLAILFLFKAHSWGQGPYVSDSSLAPHRALCITVSQKIFSEYIMLSPAGKPVGTVTHPFDLYPPPPLPHLFLLLYFHFTLTNAFFLMYFCCWNRALTHSHRPLFSLLTLKVFLLSFLQNTSVMTLPTPLPWVSELQTYTVGVVHPSRAPGV